MVSAADVRAYRETIRTMIGRCTEEFLSSASQGERKGNGCQIISWETQGRSFGIAYDAGKMYGRAGEGRLHEQKLTLEQTPKFPLRTHFH
ncbi:hypothetical protein AVEN_254288-1 [Araneus ventricosus]|uniref:Uncharacterized protein n=1 Tax=Araneus ventricosus TaxID=182803 RepID=A0A4Y2FDK5_ARAVE|nr:hypothetical protein AVEN_254288-1 [Araneus ventricosus]